MGSDASNVIQAIGDPSFEGPEAIVIHDIKRACWPIVEVACATMSLVRRIWCLTSLLVLVFAPFLILLVLMLYLFPFLM